MGVEQDARNLGLSTYTGFEAAGTEPGNNTAEKSKGLDPSPLLRIIRRNLLLIGGITAVVTAAATYAGMNSASTYQGGFRILVEPITSQGRSTDPSAISRGDRTDTNDNVDYPTLLQVLQSPERLDKVAKQVRARDPNSTVTAETLQKDIARKNLVIQRIGTNQLDNTRIVDVTYKGRNPEEVKLVLEELAKGYLRYSLEDRRNRIGGGIEFIEDQLPSLQKRVNSLEAALQDLKQRYRLNDPESEGETLAKQLQETRAQRQAAERELAEQQALYNRLRTQVGLAPNEAIAASTLSENTNYQSLIAELKKVEAQIAIKAARFNENSPVLSSLIQQRNNLTQLLQIEATRNLAGQAGSKAAVSDKILAFQNALRIDLIKQMVTADNSRQLLDIRARSVAQAETALDQRLQQFPAIVRQYNDLQQQLDIATKTLNQFLTQRETLRIEAAQKEVPWEIVANPELEKDAKGAPLPSASAAPKMMIVGLLAGLVLGLAAALLREKLRNVFLSSEDAYGALHLPALGIVPFKRGLNQAREPLNIANKDAFTRAFSSLYTNIRFLKSNPVRSIVLGSAGFGDGKTTIAVYLAQVAAAMGQRVLLVDANLRLPEIHTLVDVPNSRGLANVLADEKLAWEEVIQRSPIDKHLSVLTAGEVSLNSARLLASNEMQTLMQQFHAAYDLVIYDAPNLAEFSDANFLAERTDGVVMVVGIGRTKRPQINRVMSELRKFRQPLLGLVTNHPGRSMSTSASYGSAYDQTYEGQPLLESIKVFKSPSSTSGEVSR